MSSAGLLPSPAVAAVTRDAEWLAHRYDPDHDAFHYRRVSRPRHAQVPFLTDELLGDADRTPVLARAGAADATPPGELRFIFHSAFCASTMLARASDRPGVSMGLSEPVLLNDMVGWRRRGADVRLHGRVLSDVLAQLARPFSPGEAVVVKPSNVVNPLAAAMLALRPEARAVLLYAPLPVFLASVARKGLWCRLWCRELLEGYLQDGFVDLGFEVRDYFRQTDLQVAAVGWLAQHAWFASLARRFGPKRIATLDSERLTGAPAETVAAVARFYGLPAPRAEERVGAAIARNSKTGRSFAPGERDEEQRAARAAHGDEIDKVLVWAEAVAGNAGIVLDAPSPLPA